MFDQLKKEKKKILTLRVKNNIEKGEWRKLIAALPVAEEAGISKPLLRKAYMLAGDYFKNKEPYSDAIIYYSKAVSILADEPVYMKLIASIKLFYELFENEFSKSDLQHLQTSLRFLYNKTISAFPNSLVLLKELNSIIAAAKILEESTAKELIESRATFQVNKIYDGFYRPKSPQEVFERFSEVINDSFQDFYDEESKKESESDKKKKKSKKKKKDKEE
jgi:tetratricopeptide (TPR) repeat protein